MKRERERERERKEEGKKREREGNMEKIDIKTYKKVRDKDSLHKRAERKREEKR